VRGAPDWKPDPRNPYSSSPRVIRLHIWDGIHLIGQFDVSAGGDFTNTLQEPYNGLGGHIFNMNGQEIQWGLGVSIQVGAARGGKLHFASVAADFDY
jgi:hypothetical protein